MEDASDDEALLVMQEITGCIKAIYELVGHAKDKSLDCSDLLSKIDSIGKPLEQMSQSSKLSGDVRASLQRLLTILDQAKKMVTEASLTNKSNQEEEQQQYEEEEEAVEVSDQVTQTSSTQSREGLDQQVAATASLFLQISLLFKNKIIDEEMRGLLKDLLIAGATEKVHEAMSQLTAGLAGQAQAQ